MARKFLWSKDKYVALIKGDRINEVESLRTYFKGFDKKDGFDPNKFEKWTPTMRRKVRTAFHRLEILQAQPKRIVKARGKNLEKLKDAFHGDVPSKDMKVALIPDTEPTLTLPGSKKNKPKLRILKEGVSIERGSYNRVFVPFNQKSLVKNARQEIQRVAAQMPNAKLFYVQVGEYQTLNGKSLNLVAQQVLDWMAQYDGKRALPASSGNRGDDPRHHHWKKWLNGLVGYELPKHVDFRQVARIIREGRKKNEQMVNERRKFMKRQSRKGRK